MNKSICATYKWFLLDNQITADSNIKVLALYTGDFISIMGKLLVDKTYNFRSSLLVQTFDTLIEQLREKALPTEKDWMVRTWVNMVNDAQKLRLDLGELPEDTFMVLTE